MNLNINLFFKNIIISCLVFALMTGTTLPCYADSFFGEFTIKDEIKLGKEFDKMIHKRMNVIVDPQVTEYVSKVVERVANQLPPQPFPIRAAVINNNSMNAFAIPGGYIYIFTGLILNLNTEGELAAVIGHELAHVSLHHVADRMEKMKKVNFASMLGTLAGMMLGIAGGKNTAAVGQALAVGSMAGAQSAFLTYTQQNEKEADHLGLNYLIKAGFNPESMINSFKLMKQRQWYVSNSNIPSYLATHPGLDTRIDYLQDRLKRMPPIYLKRENDNSNFIKIKTLVRAKLTSPDVALAHYKGTPKNKLTCLDHLALAIIHSRLKQKGIAEKEFNIASKDCPNDPLILREQGIFYFNQGDMDKASPLINRAYLKKPNDVISLFYLARIEGERKNYDQAIYTMRMVSEILPEDSEVRYFLGRMLGQSGNYFEAHIQLTYSAYYQNDDKQIQFHLKKAQGLAKTKAQKNSLKKLENLINPKPETKDK